MIWLGVGLLLGAVIGAVVARRLGSDGRSSAVADASGSHERPVIGEEHDASIDDVGFVLRQAANEIELGVVVCDERGRIVYRNQAASRMTGTHVGVILDAHLDQALASSRAGDTTENQVDLAGPPRTSLRILSDPMPNGFAVATIEDVSEQARIDAVRTDFVANISHELKTPVGAIAVLAEALIDEADVDVVHRVSERLVHEAHRAAKSIDDLLELSRIEAASRLDDVVSLHEVVQAAIARGRLEAEERGITVSGFETPVDVRLRGDETQLASAIGNLVENAVKYSNRGGTVQVRTRVDASAVEVMVVDQGVGIPPRDLDRIFERFYRVDRARSRETGGTGLGLSIVRHVAGNHGGEVLVQSQEGEGSTFVLRLPAALIVDGEPLDATEPGTPTEPFADPVAGRAGDADHLEGPQR